MRAWLAAAGMPTAGPALSQGACGEAVTRLDPNDCAHAARQEADAALNLAYGEASAQAETHDEHPGGRAEETLRVAQRAWVACRDAACEAQAAVRDGGSMEPMIRNGCLEALTLRRTEDLSTDLEY